MDVCLTSSRLGSGWAGDVADSPGSDEKVPTHETTALMAVAVLGRPATNHHPLRGIALRLTETQKGTDQNKQTNTQKQSLT